MKWFIPLGDIVILEENNLEPRENCPANIVALKSQACTVRDQILLEEKAADDKVIIWFKFTLFLFLISISFNFNDSLFFLSLLTIVTFLRLFVTHNNTKH